jgi:hypothetical protein
MTVGALAREMVGRGITTVTVGAIIKAAVIKVSLRPDTCIVTVGALTREMISRSVAAVTIGAVVKTAVIKVYLAPIAGVMAA